MPIVGTGGGRPSGFNVSDYSHSTVFTIFQDTLVHENAPPLVTRWEAPPDCHGRWMLVDTGGKTENEVEFSQSRPPLVTPSSGPLPSSKIPPSSTTIFQYTAWSLDHDPLFKSCQPYSDMPLYSPGVCPDGQQVAEVTEIHANKTDGGVQTSWRASCCSSGMTFGSDVERYCQSTITSPLNVHAYITISEGSTTTSVYENYTTIGDSTSTIINMTSVATGLAVADPVVVAWALEDMASFPPDYRTSLANKIGVAMPSATPASTSSLPSPTGGLDSSPGPSLSPGAKAGIGVGVVLGVALITGIIALLWLRRRKREPAVNPSQAGVSEMEAQDANNAKKKSFLGGRWRSEVEASETPAQELDSTAVHVVPGPPAELDSSQVRNDEAVQR